MSKIDHSQIKGLSGTVGNEDYYEEIIRTDGMVSSVIIWTNPAKVLKISEAQYTRGFNNQVTEITTLQYNGVGAVEETFTETIDRTCGSVDSITKVKI